VAEAVNKIGNYVSNDYYAHLSRDYDVAKKALDVVRTEAHKDLVRVISVHRIWMEIGRVDRNVAAHSIRKLKSSTSVKVVCQHIQTKLQRNPNDNSPQ
jgi:hypothetical protein